MDSIAKGLMRPRKTTDCEIHPERRPLHPIEIASCMYCMPFFAQDPLGFLLRPLLDSLGQTRPARRQQQ